MTNNTSHYDPADLASKFINQTGRTIFLTGKAGTGKTTFLKHIAQSTHKKSVIVAPTGIAAINAGGTTIHSLFQLPFGSFVPVNQSNAGNNQNFKINDPASVIRNLQMSDNKRKLLRELELLIIDEVSMLRADLLDAIDTVLKHVRRNNFLPFGGVQVLFIGDLLQLPPVVKDQEWEVLKAFYKSVYFFDARVLQQDKPVYIELEKIYRQGDNVFVSLLNNLRNNQISSKDVELLNQFYKPDFKSTASENYITLTTHNYKADSLNKIFFEENKEPSCFFNAAIDGEFSEYNYPVEKRLELKKGAQVMLIKNDPTGAQRFFNGKIGIISNISDSLIQVKFNDSEKSVEIEKYRWENVKYELNKTNNEIEGTVIGSYTQYPIKLAWAITVHKSQGLTFDKAIIDIGQAFAPGQVYVALSRLRSLQGLVLISPINFNAISQDYKVTEYSKTKTEQENPEEQIKNERIVFFKSYLIHCFDLNQLVQLVYDHSNSYLKEGKRSTKQKHHAWAEDLKNQVIEIKPHADKFIQQITKIIDAKEAGYLELMNNRMASANQYFSAFYKKTALSILAQIEKVKAEKEVKYYISELLELELFFYEQLKKTNKALVISATMITNVEISKEEISKLTEDKTRVDKLNEAFAHKDQKGEKSKKAVRERKIKEKNTANKEPKIDTKTQTYQLFKDGKTVLEIAKIRNMTVTTIEGHLAYYVTKGEIKASLFVAEEKMEQIITTSKQLDTFQLSPIKQALGDDYSYSEIRIALAHYLASDKEKNK